MKKPLEADQRESWGKGNRGRELDVLAAVVPVRSKELPLPPIPGAAGVGCQWEWGRRGDKTENQVALESPWHPAGAGERALPRMGCVKGRVGSGGGEVKLSNPLVWLRANSSQRVWGHILDLPLTSSNTLRPGQPRNLARTPALDDSLLALYCTG